MRKVAFALVVVVGLALAAHGAQAAEKKEKPDATVKLTTGSVAVGVGYSWGGGDLMYKGKKYPISIDGVSVGDVGVSKATASGNVYHLKSLSDFEGNYTAGSAGATLGGGGSATAMKNQNGVVIKIYSTTRGLKLKLAAEGVKIAFKK
jgi:hypothetical protein